MTSCRTKETSQEPAHHGPTDSNPSADQEAQKAAGQPAEQASPIPEDPSHQSSHATANDSNRIKIEKTEQADASIVIETQKTPDVDPELAVQAVSDAAAATEHMRTE